MASHPARFSKRAEKDYAMAQAEAKVLEAAFSEEVKKKCCTVEDRAFKAITLDSVFVEDAVDMDSEDEESESGDEPPEEPLPPHQQPYRQQMLLQQQQQEQQREQEQQPQPCLPKRPRGHPCNNPLAEAIPPPIRPRSRTPP
ncbi:hypothetical protein HOLleu_05806 [Holothuria leucospilota]|uniref:Uncharacterized protein n=1 Tax=Holothuria leucospilota TaxID=206669 RepID=A0A9Q1CM64_HOLLE|nr:hypothetical protein HOLleu_05806 [Holothuria leucospilota]